MVDGKKQNHFFLLKMRNMVKFNIFCSLYITECTLLFQITSEKWETFFFPFYIDISFQNSDVNKMNKRKK